MATKTCSKCGEEKPLDEFHRNRSRKDGLQARCKSCHAAAVADSRKKNPDTMIRYRRQNKEKLNAYRARLYREKAAHEREVRRRYRVNNSLKIRVMKRRSRANPTNRAKACAYKRRYYRENPAQNAKEVAARRARKVGAIQGDPIALAARLKEIYASPCARCGTTENIHADHVIPLSKGGHHAAYNLQPLCGSCNSSKGARLTPLLPEKT